MDEYAQILKKQCIINLYLQSKSAKVYSFLQNALTIPNIVIGGIMSVTIFSVTNEGWKITAGVLAIISTILTSMTKQFGAGERSQMHCAMVRQYNSLIQELDMFIHMKHVTEDDKKACMERVRQQLNKLFDMQPDPSMFAVMQYEKQYKTHIETAMFDEFETAALHNASYVERRLSRTKPPSISLREAHGAPDTRDV
jgi:hypothetical protein